MLAPDRRQAIIDKIPEAPCIRALHIDVRELDEGRVRLHAAHDKNFNGLLDGFHGGMMAAVADCAAWFAIATLTGPEELMVTTDMNIRYLNPCQTDLLVTGRVIKLGKTLSPVHVDLYDTTELHVATGIVTYLRITSLKGRR